MNIIFDELFIFDKMEKKAYRTTFDLGLNIITCSSIDGTNRGKSVLLRSLYHSLGADSCFEPAWHEKTKIYILKFRIGIDTYYIYRAESLFKIFDENKVLIFSTINRTELSEFLSKLWDFRIYLPDKNSESLVLTPPAFTYLPYFIDQDKYNGSNLISFKSLGQFSNYKESTIYYHLGLYDKNYFDKVNKKTNMEKELNLIRLDYDRALGIKNEINELLEDVVCPNDMQELEDELTLKTENYNRIINSMNEVRKKLISYRSDLKGQEIALLQVNKFTKIKEQEIANIVKKNICPECLSVLSEPILLRSKKYNAIDDVLSLNDSIKVDMNKLEKKIVNAENEYKELLLEMEKFEENLKFSKQEIDNYSRFKGLNELQNKQNKKITKFLDTIAKLEIEIDDIKKEIKKINSRKKEINQEYHKKMLILKNTFDLNELSDDKIKSINKTFSLSGSSNPISTVIWYLTLHSLKREVNLDATIFPMVFDSPDNADMDENGRHKLIQHILDSSEMFQQTIFSIIGFEKERYDIEKDCKIEFLRNDKYSLLNEEMYKENYELLHFMNEA